MTVYGYARVSTKGQDLESQVQALETERVDRIFEEKFTGTKKERPKFTQLLQILERGDKVVVTKLDRFARSTIDALTTINELNERGVDLMVLDMGGEKIDTSTASGKLLFTVMSGFAEFEREMIVQRTQEGKAIARQRPDYKEGRPKKFSKVQLDHAMELKKTHSFKQVAEMTGISMATLKRESKIKAID